MEGNLPSLLGITLNHIDAHKCVHGQTTETDQEETEEYKEQRPLIRVVTSVTEQERSRNTSHKREDQADQVCLGLTLATVASSMPVGDLVSEVATKEPDKRRSHDNGQDDEAELVELELQAENDTRGVLLRGREGTDEDGVEGDDPEHVGEEGCLDRLGDGPAAVLPVSRDAEEAEVVLVGAVAVLGVLETRAGLTGAKGVNFLASCLCVSLRNIYVIAVNEQIQYVPSSAGERFHLVSGTRNIMAIQTSRPVPAVM